jgi:hypothetical protein
MITLSGTIMPILWLDPNRPTLTTGRTYGGGGGVKHAHHIEGQDGRAEATQREGGAGARWGTKFDARARGAATLCRAHMWGARTSAVQHTHLPDEVGRAMLAVLGRSPEFGDVGFHCEPGPCIFQSLDQPGAHRQGRAVTDRNTRRACAYIVYSQRPAPAHRYHPRATFDHGSSAAVCSDQGNAHATPLTDRTRPRLHPGRHLPARGRCAVVAPKPAVPLAFNSPLSPPVP